MHYPDGFIYPEDPAKLVHVGWLERGHDFPRGEVTRLFFTKLIEICETPFEPFMTMGRHLCDLHQFTEGGPASITFEDRVAKNLFSSNLFIPDGKQIFYAPSAIVYYIDIFFYRPPDSFIEAVLKSPPMHSMDFKRLFLESGGRALIKN